MLSVATGHDVGYLTGAVGGGREGYYTGATAAGEPPGLWYGAGAVALGLRGEVDGDLLEALYTHLLDPRDPAAHDRSTWGRAATLGRPHKNYKTAEDIYAAALAREPGAGPERRAELRAAAERSERHAVSFIDVTWSAPKSMSVLQVAFNKAADDARAAGDTLAAEAWATHAQAVEDAALAGARAGLAYLQERAGFARVGHHGGGAGRWVDAQGWVVAQFPQHDSREHDPQLHVHGAIWNRALCADGEWRALDSRAIKAFKAAAGVIADRVAEAHLARSTGVEHATRPDGKAREVVGVSEELTWAMSSRSHAIGPKAQQLVAAFTERYGRAPTRLERHQLAEQATLATRKAKSHHGETATQQLDRWEVQTRRVVDGGLTAVAHAVLARAQRRAPAARWSETDVLDRALASLEDRASASESEVMKAISDQLPANLDLAPEAVPDLLGGLTERALAHGDRLTPEEDTTDLPAADIRRDGRSVYEKPGGARWAMPGQISTQLGLRAAAVRRGAATLSAEEADAALARLAEHGIKPGADQRAAILGVLTSGAWIESLCAAAGTGKSFTVGAIADTWTASGRRVFGLATSQAATKVLAEENVTARNISSWLIAQERLDRAEPGGSDPGCDKPWRLQAGDLVVVDEAGMADTPDLAAIQSRCEAAGAKLLLTGDPRQLAAVGAGGTFADLAAHGVRYQLAEVRRFSNDWERTASLQLRDGDPAALDTYQRHGRLLDGETAEQAETDAARAWLADTLAGRESLLLVGSNTAAGRVSAALRADLVALGRVREEGVALPRQGTVAGIGDLVQARRNGWELIGWEGNTRAPINRECYRVTGLRADGGLTVAPVLGRGDDDERLGAPLHLPASYVAEDVTLGYASTVHAAQGRTVDTAHAVIAPNTDAGAAYVALTRGRDRNTAYVVTRAVPADAATGQTHEVTERSARAVLADVIERDPGEADLTALVVREQAEQTARSVMTHVDRLTDRVATLTAGRTGAELDHLAASGALSALDRQRIAADGAYGSLEQLLRRAELAGHDPAAVLRDAAGGRDFEGVRFPAQALHARIRKSLDGQLTPQVSSFADLIPGVELSESDRRLLTAHAEAADDRRRELGAETAAAAPQWAIEALGRVPDDPIPRAEWEHAAGWAAAHRELVGHTDPADALGAAPPAGLAEKQASWHTAHVALGLIDGGGDEHQLSDGVLRMRVRAFEREEAWAPRYVGDELDATSQRAEQARADALVWAARAEATEDAAMAAQLRADAAAADAEAAKLAERAAQLEIADAARGAWYAATAATRDAAHRARGALQARGVDVDAEDERVTAAEWLAAHRAEQAAEDEYRVVRDDAELIDAQSSDDVQHDDAAADTAVPPEVAEPEPAWDRTAAERPEPVTEINVPDIRDVSEPDAAEHSDPAQRHRLPTADETAASVARAQTALAEIAARREADAERETRDAQEADRRDELARWAEQDPAAEQAAAVEDGDGRDELVLER